MESTNIIDPYSKVCKFQGCRKPFKATRLNQEYHSPDCKKKANNGKAAGERILTKEIDDIIKLNRKILEQFYSIGKTIVEWNELLSKGFDYTKHTGRCADANGNYTIPQFHNYTIEKSNNNQIKINKLW